MKLGRTRAASAHYVRKKAKPLAVPIGDLVATWQHVVCPGCGRGDEDVKAPPLAELSEDDRLCDVCWGV